ncbi:hypothetical protein Poli38472_013650 [Pythium oligandrum]|uniref:Uncharacterized protein n=1 Tax=Pythium oligandrum TaxID=41045 RepID=A0A8K1FIW9_PYTOL|nr:hypothetical protein Poli38472_013650 [Pythium oligandrum]|eukprot:TMW61187.1 hypothetical protein Poli38472_013650 [Pythium oligandrum]
MALETKGFTVLSVNNLPREFTYTLHVNNANDELTITLKDRSTKERWKTNSLHLEDFVNEGNAFPQAQLTHYVRRIIACVKFSLRFPRQVINVYNASNFERVLTMDPDSCEVKLSWQVEWGDFRPILMYKFTLKPEPMRLEAPVPVVHQPQEELMLVELVSNFTRGSSEPLGWTVGLSTGGGFHMDEQCKVMTLERDGIYSILFNGEWKVDAAITVDLLINDNVVRSLHLGRSAPTGVQVLVKEMKKEDAMKVVARGSLLQTVSFACSLTIHQLRRM